MGLIEYGIANQYGNPFLSPGGEVWGEVTLPNYISMQHFVSTGVFIINTIK
jgi:hypothetical protein